jgi:flagellar hook protein FlgE
MGVFDALTNAVTGLQAQSFALQNISGNIANSQTTAFKRTDTSFSDLVQDNVSRLQVAGSVTAESRSTNSVQGSIQSSSIGTFMAVNGQGFFVVQKPSGFNGGLPVFNDANLYSRRGDFQENKDGYLVNGAGYFLMGIPIDATTGNPIGSSPQVLQFNNNILPAQVTTQLQYTANLASNPLPASAKSGVLGSELLNPASFIANPIAGAPPNAKISGTGATLLQDAPAIVTGTTDLTPLPTGGVAGTLVINGFTINTIVAGDDRNQIVTKINAVMGAGFASLSATNRLVLTSANATTAITIGGASTPALMTELGLTNGTTNPTNLITQGAAGTTQTLVITIGANPPQTITFGPGGPPANAQTLAELNAALASMNPAIGTASVNALNGNITITAANSPPDQITISGTVNPGNFGIHNLTALPANGTVIANDLTAFLNMSLTGGSITAYDSAGSPANVQFRWAKVNSVSSGGIDTWNLFYQINSNATGIQPAWQNVGTNFTFASNGQMNPPIANLTIPNMTVNGVALGNISLNFGVGGLTQFGNPSGNVQVNNFSQNGSAAGTLQSISVNDQGHVTGSFSNGRTVDLAQITLANFSGQDFLKKVDGGAFAQTAESGVPLLNATGRVVGGSLEASNTDIADEFTKLIVTQQAYSANTKIITTGNQMIQDLLSVVR